MGLERWSLAFFDDPAWVHEILDHLLWLVLEVFERAVNEVQFDFAFIWEDLGMKTGPMVSPRIFREFMLPRYKKLCDFLHGHGIEVIMVDSDGQNGPIIPLWLEAGVTGIRPLEVAAGEDAVALRRQYGKRLMLEGNIDKRVLARSHAEIEAHVLSKVPWLLTQGGYIPQVDHLTPPDVSFDNYCFFWELIQKVAAEPEHYLHEARQRGLWID
jgi:uroporphyrinogen decarboxylase